MRFIESILLKDGVYHNLDLHQLRIDRVFKKYAPGLSSHDLSGILPDLAMEGTYKVRMVYDMDSEDATYDLEFSAYQPRKIESLEIISSAPFDYSHKYEDRARINQMLQGGNADDIIIAIDNWVTDGSYFNLAFFDGKNWYTPDTPLLHGIRRTQLLRDEKMEERPILIDEIHKYEKVSLINAMLDLGELTLATTAIAFPKNVA